MDGSGQAYAESLDGGPRDRSASSLDEIDDWNCCGAFEYLAISQLRGHALSAATWRSPSSSATARSTLVAPCSACFLNLAKTDHTLRDDPALSAHVNDGAGGRWPALHAGLGAGPPPARGAHRRGRARRGRAPRHRGRCTGCAWRPTWAASSSRPDYDRRWSAPRASARVRPAAGRAGRRGRRLPAADRLLRRPHDPDQPGHRVRADPAPGRRGRPAGGGHAGHGLPDVPDERRRSTRPR